MYWRRRRLNERFGIELTGMEIGPAAPRAALVEVREAAWEFGVAVLPGQALSDQDLLDFAGALGEVYPMPSSDYGSTAVTGLTNMDAEGNILPADHRSLQMTLANELWHTDSTFMRPRVTLSMLFAQTIPPEGGETEFCDTRVLYESLTPQEQARFEGLTATHWFVHSRTLSGLTDWTEEEQARWPLVDRALVHLHRESGRKAVCLASHIAHLSGLDDDEAQGLVDELTRRATQPDRVYAHGWSVGDLLIWDNRCMMHRGRPYDRRRHRRNMRTVRLMDPADPGVVRA
jgi:alpha-ketoglutarate-dependent 2,4-dichlorophenoxyacetate dioxygenase